MAGHDPGGTTVDRVTVRLPAELRAQLEDRAREDGVSVSEVIRRAIEWRCRQG